MTLIEVQQRHNAIFKALDSISVSGYKNVLNMAASMQILDEIIHSELRDDVSSDHT